MPAAKTLDGGIKETIRYTFGCNQGSAQEHRSGRGGEAMRSQQAVPSERRDVVAQTDAAVSEAMLKVYRSAGALAAPDQRVAQQPADEERRLARRDALLEPRSSDPNGYERIIGESDLTSINYLDRGRRAAAAVCRIRVPAEGGEWYGTGFLVGPRLLMTNNHVLSTRDEASQASAEFGYEHDVDGVLKPPIQYNLQPHDTFFTDPELDVTLVAVTPLSDSGEPLDRFGWLPLLPLSGKGVDREWVTIIQHPGGGPKQISIRSSRIVSLDGAAPGANAGHFIHYLTDTEPGSSGAPVVNDQWQVVALHHKAVPAPADPKKPDAPTVWIGNEGVRISAIYRLLEQRRLEDPNALRVLNRLEVSLGFSTMPQIVGSGGESDLERDSRPYAPKRWNRDSGIGYDPGFLSAKVDLSKIYARYPRKVAPLLDGSGSELKYHRFSVVVDAERKFALIAAVNIHGELLRHPGARKSTWRQDARMDPVFQPDGEFYEKAKGTDAIQFSRGHLVRRFDPCWGDDDSDAERGNEDTFHYANAAPQFQAYNDSDWGNLEDYLLDRAQTTEKKMTVFQGPIFRDDDPFYGRDRKGGPWRIPLSYWKIAVLQKTERKIAVAAFIVGQTQYVDALYEAKVFSGLNPYRPEEIRSRKIQTTVATVEAETGLDFSAIRRFDAQGGLESTRQTRWINRLGDIQI